MHNRILPCFTHSLTRLPPKICKLKICCELGLVVNFKMPENKTKQIPKPLSPSYDQHTSQVSLYNACLIVNMVVKASLHSILQRVEWRQKWIIISVLTWHSKTCLFLSCCRIVFSAFASVICPKKILKKKEKRILSEANLRFSLFCSFTRIKVSKGLLSCVNLYFLLDEVNFPITSNIRTHLCITTLEKRYILTSSIPKYLMTNYFSSAWRVFTYIPLTKYWQKCQMWNKHNTSTPNSYTTPYPHILHLKIIFKPTICVKQMMLLNRKFLQHISGNSVTEVHHKREIYDICVRIC